VRRHSLRVLERGALEVGGYAGRAERVAAELDLEASTGRAPADHAIGVDTVGAPPVLGDFFEIAGQHRDNFVDIGAFVRSQPGDRRRRSLLEFIQQFRRRASIDSLVTHRWREPDSKPRSHPTAVAAVHDAPESVGDPQSARTATDHELFADQPDRAALCSRLTANIPRGRRRPLTAL
jgi:hypothetical protein